MSCYPDCLKRTLCMESTQKASQTASIECASLTREPPRINELQTEVTLMQLLGLLFLVPPFKVP